MVPKSHNAVNRSPVDGKRPTPTLDEHTVFNEVFHETILKVNRPFRNDDFSEGQQKLINIRVYRTAIEIMLHTLTPYTLP